MIYLLILFLLFCLLNADPVPAVVYPGGSWCWTARCVTSEPVGEGWWLLTADLRAENQISWRKDVVVFRKGDEFENRRAAFVRTKVAGTKTGTKEDRLPSDAIADTIAQQELAKEVSRTKLELIEVKKKLNEGWMDVVTPPLLWILLTVIFGIFLN